MGAIAKVVVVTNQALKDGFQAGQDLPVISVAALMELGQVLGEFKNLPEEAKAELAPFIRAAAVGVVDIVEAALA